MIKNEFEQFIGPFLPGLMPGAEPFYFPGGETGIVLAHGFTSHPAEMRELGEWLAARGLSVLGVLLPGHGTRPEDLAPTPWTAWDEAVYRGCEWLSKRCARVFAAGSSTGGTLALHASLNMPLAGVIGLAPPVYGLVDPRARFARWIKYVVATAQKHGRSVNDPSVDPVAFGYAVNPVAAVEQLWRCLGHVQTCLPAMKAPLLVCHAVHDPIVPFWSSERLMERVASPDKSLIRLERSAHMLTLDFEKAEVFGHLLAFLEHHAPSSVQPSRV